MTFFSEKTMSNNLLMIDESTLIFLKLGTYTRKKLQCKNWQKMEKNPRSALPIVNLFTISIDFNQFQSISITFNPKFKWGLGLDRKSHILGEIGIVTIAILHFC